MKLHIFWTILTLIITLVTRTTNAQIIQAIRDLLQYNVAGVPQIHEEMKFEFDPEVSKKRREVYEELHGFRGEKLIERLGQGIDGNHKERLAYQRSRDEGHLGGVNYFTT